MDHSHAANGDQSTINALYPPLLEDTSSPLVSFYFSHGVCWKCWTSFSWAQTWASVKGGPNTFHGCHGRHATYLY
jgi:hypothetical protein